MYPAGVKELTPEDVTPNAPSLVVYSRKGYIKRMSADTFTVQGRAGRGGVDAERFVGGGRAGVGEGGEGEIAMSRLIVQESGTARGGSALAPWSQLCCAAPGPVRPPHRAPDLTKHLA